MSSQKSLLSWEKSAFHDRNGIDLLFGNLTTYPVRPYPLRYSGHQFRQSWTQHLSKKIGLVSMSHKRGQNRKQEYEIVLSLKSLLEQ